MRPGKHQYYLTLAAAVSLRGTCARRKVGCVLVDVHDRVSATGYNGVARGLTHCIEKACPGADAPSGTGLDLCEAIHAEANAIAACRNVDELAACFVTVSPCVSCVKLLMGTSCKSIIFMAPYSHDRAASRLWVSSGRDRTWVHLPYEPAKKVFDLGELG